MVPVSCLEHQPFVFWREKTTNDEEMQETVRTK